MKKRNNILKKKQLTNPHCGIIIISTYETVEKEE